MGGFQSDVEVVRQRSAPKVQVAQRLSWIFRHSAIVRVTHWINFLCLAVLLMSGLQIFNAHSALYWGQESDFQHPLLAMHASPGQHGSLRGITTILDHDFDTTGVLGLSYVPGVGVRERGFPAWVTLPGMQWLAMGRRWHFFFAWIFVVNGLVYLTSGLASGHFHRDLLPTGEQLRHIGGAIWDHLRLRFPKGEEARRYNVLQKLAYLGVVLLILPCIALAGMTMSPNLDSIAPQLVILFGGRQSARTIHFLCAAVLLIFLLVHVVMVLLSGVWNNMRSMTTGWYRIEHTEDINDGTA
ncbi:MAG TPA: cytochrome b/b6 domain-containing protein [Methylocella sp.]|nr:cytochrome b/b6 domain-containing protein [Methylocella sp.]